MNSRIVQVNTCIFHASNASISNNLHYLLALFELFELFELFKLFVSMRVIFLILDRTYLQMIIIHLPEPLDQCYTFRKKLVHFIQELQILFIS